MDEHFLRAERFLQAIGERAERARIALSEDDWDGFEEAMKWKSAAFHHFRAIDHIVAQANPDYLKEERWQELWRRVCDCEAALTGQIEAYQTNLNQTLGKIRKTKVALGRYHSGHKEESDFIDGV